MRSTSERVRVVFTTVGEHLLSYAINGDSSGLTKAEIQEFNDFIKALIEDAPEDYSFGHLSVGEEKGFRECEISGWMGNCYTMEVIYFHKNA